MQKTLMIIQFNMKKTLITTCFFLFLSLEITAQEITDITPNLNLKFGKVSKEELLMSAYPNDTTANALILFHVGNSNFTYKNNEFGLLTDHIFRIKILKSSGEKYADVSILYYSPEERKESQDNIYDIEAVSYNLENGKIIKNSMKSNLISRERINDRTMLVKFSIPTTKVGSVIEYKYKSYTDYFAEIENWEMQEDIPTLYNKYHILIPNLYVYNIEMRGRDKIKIDEKEGSVHINHKTHSGVTDINNDFYISARDLTFTSYHIPALTENENYCWCPSVYKQQISFELQGTNYPDEGYKPHTQTWGDIDKLLLKKDHEKFGKQLYGLTNPFREETKKIYHESISKQEKIAKAFKYLKSQIAWNEKYELCSKEPLLAKEKKSGNNAELNFIFISMLKDLGIKAYPTILCTRKHGMLPTYLPSIQKLSTFVVAIEGENNETWFIDGSMFEPTFNTLPPVLLVNKARILNPGLEEKSKWVDFMSLNRNINQRVTDATIANNQIVGHQTSTYQDQEAFQKISNHPLSDDYSKVIKEIENECKCKILNYTQELESHYPFKLKSKMDFTIPLEESKGSIYLNPMLLVSQMGNPFVEFKRELPVEFPYTYSHHENVILTIPAEYKVEDIPESSIIATQDKKLSCKYSITQKENMLLLNYTFTIGKSIFTPAEYSQLQQVWNAIIEKQKSLVVLKKI